MQPPARLIDLDINWLLQYAPETKLFGPDPARMDSRLSQVDGYLSDTSLSFISCGQDGELIARVEAEFSGRLIFGPDDVRRWREDNSGLSWGVMASRIQDKALLPKLFDRGVRMFQVIKSSQPALNHEFLDAMAKRNSAGGPRPILDLAGAEGRTIDDVLDWFEASEERPAQILLVHRSGTLPDDTLTRFRKLGGVVSVRISSPAADSTDALLNAIHSTAQIPFLGNPGYEGITIATGFLDSDRTLPGLGNAGEVIDWTTRHFDVSTAKLLLHDNARKLIEAMAGESV